jgi:hypothetical protein
MTTQERDEAGQWSSRTLSDPEIEALARQADEQAYGYSSYSETNKQDANELRLEQEMLREDRRAEKEEASWARWDRRHR